MHPFLGRKKHNIFFILLLTFISWTNINIFLSSISIYFSHTFQFRQILIIQFQNKKQETYSHLLLSSSLIPLLPVLPLHPCHSHCLFHFLVPAPHTPAVSQYHPPASLPPQSPYGTYQLHYCCNRIFAQLRH